MKKEPQLTAAYKVLDDQKLIIHVYQGTASGESMLAYIYHLMEHLDKKTINYSAIIDSRKMNWDFLITGVNDYVEGLAKVDGLISEERKMAGIYDGSSPHQTFYTKLYHQKIMMKNQPGGYFTEVQDAINWLEKDITAKEVEDIVAEISQDPQFAWYGEGSK